MATAPKKHVGKTDFSVRYGVRVEVHADRVHLKFIDGAAIGIPRDNVSYYETIGRWFCREVGAESAEDRAAGRLP